MTASKWQGMRLLGFDTETTGTDVYNDRIVTVALVDIAYGVRPTVRTWLANPGIDIPAEATNVHGITTEHAAEHGAPPEIVLHEVTGRLALALQHNIPIVAFNAAFDLTLLEQENQRYGVPTLMERRRSVNGQIAPVIDPRVLDKYAHPFRKGGRTLVDVCRPYGVVHTGAHAADGDALAACRLVPKILDRHARKFVGQTVDGLHQSQIGWAKAQADGLREYFDKNNKPHDGVDPGWPLYVGVRRPVGGAS
ncbi:exonuclease domain-containing protein [Nocardioides speluncae]|uniref:exonuclease domain-containing protein n=1 Tax=Nocardioides speluncae TaxID=2670337 RepID=UPI00137AA2B9|nr:exonuclease domain-containing protein [Nocardioides speluncae]